jgi:hypothetical protein
LGNLWNIRGDRARGPLTNSADEERLMIEPTPSTIKYMLTRVREYLDQNNLRAAEEYLKLALAEIQKLRTKQNQEGQ